MIDFLRTPVRKQPIIALYVEFETVFKFYYLSARLCGCADWFGSSLYAHASSYPMLDPGSFLFQFCQSIGKRSFEQVFLNVKKRQAFPVCDTCTTDQIAQSSQCRDIGKHNGP